MPRLLFINATFTKYAGKANILTELDYTLTNEKFIPIDSETYNFVLKGEPKKGEVEFTSKYEKLKVLLEDKDTLVFGYDCYEQVQAICDTVRVYHLEPIDFSCYDLRVAYGEITSYEKSNDLKIIYADTIFDPVIGKFNADSPISNQLSLILQGICIKNNKDPYDIEHLCFEYHGDIFSCDFDYDVVEVKKETPGLGKNVTFDSSIIENQSLEAELLNKATSYGYEYVDDIDSSDYIICLDNKQKENAATNVKKPYLGSILTILEFDSMLS